MTRALFLILLLTVGAAQSAPSFDPLRIASIDGKPGAQVPMDRMFRTEAGRSVTLRQLGDGQPILLVPVQHRCANICGATLAGLSRTIGAKGVRPDVDFQLVAFGIDPREQAVDAKASLARLAPISGPGVHALIGAAPDIAAVTAALGYHYAWDRQTGQYAHVAAIAVLTPEGRLSTWLNGVQPPPRLLAAALGRAGHDDIRSLGDRLVLLCYHYDPVSGRYDTLALGLLRAGAALIVVALAGFIAVTLLRDRRRRPASR